MGLYIFLFVISTAVFVALISFIFPKVFLSSGRKAVETEDRGIRKLKGDDFYAVVYLPKEKFRKAIKEYVLKDKGGVKTVKCKTDGDLKYIDYEIVSFSESGEVIDVLRVKEILTEKGFTKETVIPYAANYVTVRVNETDFEKFDEPLRFVSAKGKKGAFFFFSAASAIAEALITKVCFAHFFGGVFCESFLSIKSFWLTTLILAVLIVITLPLLNLATKRRK